MASVNRVFLAGNLTRDAVLKQSDAGKPYARFGLAINNWKKGGGEDVLFIECTAFGGAAEIAGQLGKGSQVFVEGRLQLNQWTAKDGGNRREIRVVAERVEVLARKPRAEGSREPAAAPVGAVAEEVPF